MPTAHAEAATGFCALAAGQLTRVAELADLARSSLRGQADVGRHFRQPSERLDGLLKARATHD
jgi:hypothetical protein